MPTVPHSDKTVHPELSSKTPSATQQVATQQVVTQPVVTQPVPSRQVASARVASPRAEAAARQEAHRSKLQKLATRFESLEGKLTELESRIETELPKMGISVMPMGNKRKVIEGLPWSQTSGQPSTDNSPVVHQVPMPETNITSEPNASDKPVDHPTATTQLRSAKPR